MFTNKSVLSVIISNATEISTVVKIPVGTKISDKGKDVTLYASFRLPRSISGIEECLSTLRELSSKFAGTKADLVRVSVPKIENMNGVLFMVKPVYTHSGLADTLERLENKERLTRKEVAERNASLATEEAARLEAVRIAAEEASKLADTNGTPVEGTVVDATVEEPAHKGRKSRKANAESSAS